MLLRKTALSLIVASFCASAIATTEITPDAKPASKFTKEKNGALLNYLDFQNKEDFDAATKGFIAKWPDKNIKDAKGNVVWDFEAFAFVDTDKNIDTINPSLQRTAKLNNQDGLFKVVDGVYQVRGFDLSVMTFFRGKSGWIVVDPLVSEETAAAGLKLVNDNVEKLPVTAVIFTHSHVDHFGGIWGVTSKADYDNGKVAVVSPEGFFEHSISENVLAGNLMSRRAGFMYGNMAAASPTGKVDGGLGKTTSTGSLGIVEPTLIVSKTGEKHDLDGIEFDFQMAQASEAPAEFIAYIPKYKTLLASEVMTHTIHNISTLRGAQTRDASKWAAYVDESLELFAAKSDVMVASHHWPTWGADKITDQLSKTRDMYKYVHDQTLRLANEGYTPNEISATIKLPDSLDKEWYNRGYYGSVSHNSRATYDFYFGAWWDGNPANLNPLPPSEEGANYVKAIGGADKVIAIAQEAINNGEYRWAVTLLNNVVFSDPENMKARYLEADAMEQLGYQAESGPWRNYYLVGSTELRNGYKSSPAPDTLAIAKNMPVYSALQSLAVHVNPEKANGMMTRVNIQVSNDKSTKSGKYAMLLSNSVLKSYQDRNFEKADITVELDPATFTSLVIKDKSIDDLVKAGKLKISDQAKFAEFMGVFDTFKTDFGIVTP